ncbi:MAG: hypothetical protein NVS2B16_08740 [Chloroflexota bacterium]
MESEQADNRASLAGRNRQILEMRERGSSWQQIEQAFDLTRQQARYAYQLAKRAERRSASRTRT